MRREQLNVKIQDGKGRNAEEGFNIDRIPIEEIPPDIRGRFQAEREGNLPDYFFKKLLYLNYCGINDKPPDTIKTSDHSNSKRNEMIKYRGAFFCEVFYILDDCSKSEAIKDKMVKEEISRFREGDFSHFKEGKHTTIKQVEQINEVMGLVIKTLKEENDLEYPKKYIRKLRLKK